ncbi:MAG: 16S rRNA (cytosine(1402)-N(4))-methyltransferase RsmH [Deltaproteobacteria bacterium]|nr:16S rRNA (cytosine(1402)-N(4))-methyltransferase RsmH [Deltaproteobacteria bacterium]
MHAPVLLKEAVDALNIKPNGCYLDCTGGLGGHAAAILGRLSAEARLLICDYHRETAESLKQRFTDNRVSVFNCRFSQIFDNLAFHFDGILADLGISSAQLLDAALGIGFSLKNVFLDMRIDQTLQTTAADILKFSSEEQLADIFYYHGGERAARKMARVIIADRKKNVLYTQTHELADLCSRVLGKYYRGKKIHPATKVFQALRIVVNKEHEEIEALLKTAPGFLNPGGRLVMIAFHSGEDRLVKTKFKELAKSGLYSLPFKKAVKPERQEILSNQRSRSARMRVLQAEEGS